MPDGDEEAADFEGGRLARDGVLEDDARDHLVAELVLVGLKIFNDLVPEDLGVGLGEYRSCMTCSRGFVASVDDVDGRGELGEVGGLFHRCRPRRRRPAACRGTWAGAIADGAGGDAPPPPGRVASRIRGPSSWLWPGGEDDGVGEDGFARVGGGFVGLVWVGSPGLMDDVAGWVVVPSCSACFWNICIISGPETPSGKPG